jgi:hypothetical protein
MRHAVLGRAADALGPLVYAAMTAACATGAVWLADVASRAVLGGPTTTGVFVQLLAATAVVGTAGLTADHVLTRLSHAGRRQGRAGATRSASPPAQGGHDGDGVLQLGAEGGCMADETTRAGPRVR